MMQKSRIEADPRRYPTAEEMPEMRADAAKEQMGDQVSPEMNPILDALQVLQQYVLAAEKRGDPAAATMKSSLVGFVKSMAGGAAGAQGAEKAPAGAPKAMPPKPGEEPPEESEDAPAAEAPEGEEMPMAQAEGNDEGGEMPDAMGMKKRKLNKRVGNAMPMV